MVRIRGGHGKHYLVLHGCFGHGRWSDFFLILYSKPNNSFDTLLRLPKQHLILHYKGSIRIECK